MQRINETTFTYEEINRRKAELDQPVDVPALLANLPPKGQQTVKTSAQDSVR